MDHADPDWIRCGSCLSLSDILGLMHSPSRPRMSARASKGLNGNHWKTNSSANTEDKLSENHFDTFPSFWCFLHVLWCYASPTSGALLFERCVSSLSVYVPSPASNARPLTTPFRLSDFGETEILTEQHGAPIEHRYTKDYQRITKGWLPSWWCNVRHCCIRCIPAASLLSWACNGDSFSPGLFAGWQWLKQQTCGKTWLHCGLSGLSQLRLLQLKLISIQVGLTWSCATTCGTLSISVWITARTHNLYALVEFWVVRLRSLRHKLAWPGLVDTWNDQPISISSAYHQHIISKW